MKNTKNYAPLSLLSLLLCCFFLLYGCNSKDTSIPSEQMITPGPNATENPNSSSENLDSDLASGDSVITPTNPLTPTITIDDFISSDGSTLEDRIKTPEGFERIEAKDNEITSFIRSYPLKADGSDVLLYDDTPKSFQSGHVAVFDMALGNRDLQQCADSVIRMYGEYLWSIGAYSEINFHLTNGFLMEYSKWREGNRIIVNGNDVSWNLSATYDDSYENFINYIETVFIYAGTLSLSQECNPVPLSDIQVGDMFLYGGSPGHCVLVVDMAENKDGERSFLLAQGYMPAQDFHILKNPLHTEDPWYYETELTYPLETPSWTFEEGSLVRFADFHSISEANIAASVTLLAVGDNLIHTEVIESGLQDDGSYIFDHLYSRVKDEISAADIAVINQETIFGGDEFAYIGYPNFNSPTEIGDAVINAGFDVVLQATNHTMDKGYKGLSHAFQYWDQHPEITVLGINESPEERKTIPIIEQNGIKIAMLNYTYGLNGHEVPSDKPYLVNMLEKSQMKQDITLAHTMADFIIVFPHWGNEYVYEPTSSQKNLVEFFYQQGVDLVIGTHPHVLEPVEWIETDEDHTMLVYYSLGNFISYQKEAPRMLGGIASLTITKKGEDTYIENPNITPIVTHYEHGPADYNYGIYHLTDYNSQLADIHGVNDLAKQGRFAYPSTYSLAQQVLGTWFY